MKLTHPVSRAGPAVHGRGRAEDAQGLGEIADGTVISVLAGTEYVQWARQQIDEGRAAAGRTDHHRIVTFAMFSVDEDGSCAK